jgi:acetylglutamate kinase
MSTILVKLSGNIIADTNALGKLTEYIHERRSNGDQAVLVHGGGRQINELSRRLDLPVHQVAGRRVTDESAREVLLYTVGGKANRELVAFLRSNDISSVGISGVDGELTTAFRRPPLDIDGEPVDFGLVGEMESVDRTLIEHLLKGGYVPVIGCLTWSPEDGILNINADTFSIRIALALQVGELIMLMDPPAVLDGKGKPVPGMHRTDWQRGLQEGWITDGMKPKLQTAFEALDKGVASVILANADTLAAGGGTRIQP